MTSRRTRLMMAGLGSTTVLWTMDWLSSSSPVKPASAAQPAGVAALIPTSRPAPLDVAALIAQVRAEATRSEAPRAVDGMRNPFVSTGALAEIEKLRIATGGQGGTVPASETGQSAPAQPVLSLHGVITGDQPMAVINTAIVSLGGQVGGYQLTEIGRDYVVLRGEGGPLTLRMQSP